MSWNLDFSNQSFLSFYIKHEILNKNLKNNIKYVCFIFILHKFNKFFFLIPIKNSKIELRKIMNLCFDFLYRSKYIIKFKNFY